MRSVGAKVTCLAPPPEVLNKNAGRLLMLLNIRDGKTLQCLTCQ